MTSKYQRYQLRLTRTTDGKWVLTGYWENPPPGDKEWSMDGAPLYFNTRKEALTHCLNVMGVPD